MDQFNDISKNSGVLNKEQFLGNLTVFGLNWPTNRPSKFMPPEFKETMIEYFNDVHEIMKPFQWTNFFSYL